LEALDVHICRVRVMVFNGSNYLCLPKTPEWGDYTNYAEGKRGVISGVELEFI
jgi:hypothetical protein